MTLTIDRPAPPAARERLVPSPFYSERWQRPVLRTKLVPPPADASLIARPRLNAQLARLASGLLLLAAPAGYGKTTLLAQAQAAEADTGARWAWLTLDESDDELTAFLHSLSSAVAQAVPGACAACRALLEAQQRPEAAALRAALINDLALLEAPLSIVLDDYHTITAPAIHETLALLIEQRLRGLRLIIASRSLPALPLARMRARRQLLELGVAELRCTPAETDELLRISLGLPLDPATRAALHERAEGWPAGLQLTALCLRDDDGIRPWRPDGCCNRYVAEYLEDEVFGRLPWYLREFLLRTSLLERLSGPLCDALLLGEAVPAGDGPAFSQLVIDEIERRGLFLIPLDSERRHYRYQRMFAEVLRARLSAGASALELAELQARAAAYERGAQEGGEARRRSPAAQAAQRPTPARGLVEPLSQREQEVLCLIAEGKNNSEIAQELVVAVSTVKAHINSIFGKLEVSHRAAAIARARELGLIEGYISSASASRAGR